MLEMLKLSGSKEIMNRSSDSNLINDSSCEPITDCNSCLLLVQCFFLTLFGGQKICVNKKEDYHNHYQIKYIVTLPQDCPNESLFKLKSDKHRVTTDTILVTLSNHVDGEGRIDIDFETPATQHLQPMGLEFSFIPLKLYLDESISTFYSEGLLKLEWTDCPVQDGNKNPTENVIDTESFLTTYRIPKVTLENEERKLRDTLSVLDLNFEVKGASNDWLRMEASWSFATTCPLNLTGWPMDSQRCNITLSLHFESNENLPFVRVLASRAALTGKDARFFEWEPKDSWEYLSKKDDQGSDYILTAVFAYGVQRHILFAPFILLILIVLILSTSMFLFGPKRLMTKVQLNLLALLINATLLTCFRLQSPTLQSRHSRVSTLYHLNFVALLYSFLSTVTIILYAHRPSSRSFPDVPFFRWIIDRFGFEQPNSLIVFWLQLQEKVLLILYFHYSLFSIAHHVPLGWT